MDSEQNEFNAIIDAWKDLEIPEEAQMVLNSFCTQLLPILLEIITPYIAAKRSKIAASDKIAERYGEETIRMLWMSFILGANLLYNKASHPDTQRYLKYLKYAVYPSLQLVKETLTALQEENLIESKAVASMLGEYSNVFAKASSEALKTGLIFAKENKLQLAKS